MTVLASRRSHDTPVRPVRQAQPAPYPGSIPGPRRHDRAGSPDALPDDGFRNAGPDCYWQVDTEEPASA